VADSWRISGGQKIEGLEHLKQSIWDILMTPIGTRVLRRGYGSLVPSLIDKPMNPQIMIEIFSAIAIALDKWEPRFNLKLVSVDKVSPGHAEFSLKGTWFPDWPRTQNAREVELEI